MNLNLSQKALMLVVVPLTFQLAFLYGVSLLLDQSERDVKVRETTDGVRPDSTIDNQDRIPAKGGGADLQPNKLQTDKTRN